MDKHDVPLKFRYDHSKGRVYVETDTKNGPGAELAVIPHNLEYQRDAAENEPRSEQARAAESRQHGRAADPEQFAYMSDKELARHKSVLLGQLAGALDASREQNDYMVDDIMAKVLSVQKLEEYRQAQAEQNEGRIQITGPNKVTELNRADIEEVAALLEGELQEDGDDNFVQVLQALERFYSKLEAGSAASAIEREFTYEKIVILLSLAESMRFISAATSGQSSVRAETVPSPETSAPNNDIGSVKRPKRTEVKQNEEVDPASLAFEADQMDRAEQADAGAQTPRHDDTNAANSKQSVADILRRRYARMELPDTEEFEALPDEGLSEARLARIDRMQSLLDDMPDQAKANAESLEELGLLGDELIAIDHVRQVRLVQSGNRSLTPDNVPARLHKLDLNHILQAFPADLQSINRLNNVYYGLLHRVKAVAGHASSRQLVRHSLEKVELLRDIANRKFLANQTGWDEASHNSLQRMQLFTKPRQDR